MNEKLRKQKYSETRNNSKGKKKSLSIINQLLKTKYNYFNWQTVPAIQFPNDIIILQELFFNQNQNNN